MPELSRPASDLRSDRDFLLSILSCPRCPAPVRRTGTGWSCSRCAASGVIDRAGIVHLAENAGGDRSVPAGSRRGPGDEPGPFGEVTPSTSAVELTRIMGDALESEAGSPSEYWNLLSDFKPNSAGFAVLGATFAGTTSLVLNSGWGNLSRVIASFGGRAIGMDSRYPGLLHTALLQDDAHLGCVRSQLELPLPFRDASFDTVFLDDVAARVDGVRSPELDSGRPCESLVRDCARILKPGGHLVVVTWNRIHVSRDGVPPTLGENGEPRTPWRATRAGVVELLRESGYRNPTSFIPWPALPGWSRLVRETAVPHAERLPLEGDSWKRKLGRMALDAATRLGLSHYLVPSHCVVARAPRLPEAGQEPPSTLDVIAEAAGIDASSITRLDAHPNSRSLSFVTDDHFVKIPLTSEAASRISEAAIILDESGFASGPESFAVAPRRGANAGGIPLGIYPLVPHPDPNSGWDDKVTRVRFAIDRLAVDARSAPLSGTDLWHRLSDPESRREFEMLEASGELLAEVLRWEDRTVPTGIVHGDLAWGNLVRENGERIRLIDWDRCEPSSPKLLDVVHGLHSLARTYHYLAHPNSDADRILAGWRMLVHRDPAIPLLDRIETARGDLAWHQAIVLALVNEIDQHHRTLRDSPMLRRAHQAHLVARLRLARSFLEEGARP